MHWSAVEQPLLSAAVAGCFFKKKTQIKLTLRSAEPGKSLLKYGRKLALEITLWQLLLWNQNKKKTSFDSINLLYEVPAFPTHSSS